MERTKCKFDRYGCELDYSPPEYQNAFYPENGDCGKCKRNPKNFIDLDKIYDKFSWDGIKKGIKKGAKK